jgi:hypothetical protein
METGDDGAGDDEDAADPLQGVDVLTEQRQRRCRAKELASSTSATAKKSPGCLASEGIRV